MSDKGRAKWRLADLASALGERLPPAEDAPHVRPLLAGIADHSSYLWHLVESDPERLLRLLGEDPDVSLDAVLRNLVETAARTEDDIMRQLRLAKQSVALLVALADLGGAWTLEQVVQALSRAAETFIATALGFLLREAGAGRAAVDRGGQSPYGLRPHDSRSRQGSVASN